jgi:hypothetical protein
MLQERVGEGRGRPSTSETRGLVAQHTFPQASSYEHERSSPSKEEHDLSARHSCWLGRDVAPERERLEISNCTIPSYSSQNSFQDRHNAPWAEAFITASQHANEAIANIIKHCLLFEVGAFPSWSITLNQSTYLNCPTWSLYAQPTFQQARPTVLSHVTASLATRRGDLPWWYDGTSSHREAYRKWSTEEDDVEVVEAFAETRRGGHDAGNVMGTRRLRHVSDPHASPPLDRPSVPP